MNFIKKLALFTLTIVSIGSSLFSMEQKRQLSRYEAKLLPNIHAYFDKKNAFDDLHSMVVMKDGRCIMLKEHFFKEDSNGLDYYLNLPMDIDSKVFNVHALVRKAAAFGFCQGVNYTLALQSPKKGNDREQFSILPLFLSAGIGIGFGAGCIGLAWWLKSKSYF